MSVITTVKGDLRPEELGFTLSHEHLIQNMGVFAKYREFMPPIEPEKVELKVENMRLLWGSGAFYNDEVLRCDTDEYLEMITNEAFYYKEAGGKSIIECSVQGLNGRPVTDLKTISEKSGVHIIAGLGLYTPDTMPKEYLGQDEKGMKKLLEKQLDGLEGSDIKPGFLKATVNMGRNPLEITGYRAVSRLAAETGLPMLVHFIPERQYMKDFVKIAVQEFGVKPEKLLLCHVDGMLCEPQTLEQYMRTGEAPVSVELHKQLLDYGVMLSFDGFGSPFAGSSELMNNYQPTDYQRMTGLHRLIDAGYKDQIMVGHDFGCTVSTVTWGRYGLTRVPEFVCPMLKLLGYGDDIVDTITTDNPRRFLSHE